MKIRLPFISSKVSVASTVFFFSFLTFIVSFAFVNSAYAITTKTISAYPTHSTDADPRTKSWFIYTLAAGDKRTDSVTVTNSSKEPITVRIFPADSVPASNGGFALADENTKMTDLGSWITLSTSEVTLSPGEKKEIPFTIAIPSNAKGDHAGGIVIQDIIPNNVVTNRGLHINVISRFGVRIYETVPGSDQLNMQVSNFQYSVINKTLNFNFDAKDTGTVNITPTGVLILRDIFGNIISTVSLDAMLDTFVPGKTLTFAVPTSVAPPVLGWESAQVALYYSPTKVASATVMIVANPLVTFGVLFVIFFLLAVVIFRKYIVKFKGENKKMKLAPHVWMIVSVILLGTIAGSWLISYLMTFFLSGK